MDCPIASPDRCRGLPSLGVWNTPHSAKHLEEGLLQVKYARRIYFFRAVRLDLSLAIVWIFYIKLFVAVLSFEEFADAGTSLGGVTVPSLYSINALFALTLMLCLSFIPAVITYYLVKYR